MSACLCFCICFTTVPVHFQFSPDNVCQEQKQSFQSELLEFLMDIIHITGQEGGQSTHVSRDGKVILIRLLLFMF